MSNKGAKAPRGEKGVIMREKGGLYGNFARNGEKAKKRLRGGEEPPSARAAVSAERVRQMLKEEIVIDPLGRLTDHSVFDKLDESEKQRYILELAESYRRCLERLKRASAV